jgi:hypothetical protein
MADPSHGMRAFASSCGPSDGQSRRQRQQVPPSALSDRPLDLIVEGGSMKRLVPLHILAAAWLHVGHCVLQDLVGHRTTRLAGSQQVRTLPKSVEVDMRMMFAWGHCHRLHVEDSVTDWHRNWT